MTHPVFFSVAEEDKKHAQKIAEECASDHVFLYSITGKEGAEFPEELANEVGGCSYFVIFWSASYVKKEWTRRELAMAAERVKSGELNEFLIVRLDETALEQKVVNPLTSKEEDLLRPFRERRRSTNLPFNASSVLRAIGEALAVLAPAKTPLLPRPELERRMRNEIAIDYRCTKPIVFVSGLNGSGRKTLVRSVMDRDFAHLTPHLVAIDNMDGPEDLLFKLWCDVLNKSDSERETLVKNLNKNPNLMVTYLKAALQELVARKAYLLITQESLGDNEAILPYWVPECFGDVQPTRHPLLFYVLSRQLKDQFLQNRFAAAGAVHVYNLEEIESKQLVFSLVQALDDRPMRWSDKNIQQVVVAGGGCPELIKDIVKIGVREQSLDFLEKRLSPVVDRFTERLSAWVSMAIEQIQDVPDNLKILYTVDRLDIADLDSLQEILLGESGTIGGNIYKLRTVGLLEQLADGVYRIPPLIRRKLNIYFTQGSIRADVRKQLERFARDDIKVGNDDYGSIYINNKLTAKLSEGVVLSDSEEQFLTAALLFKAGWGCYRSAEYARALNLLRRAFGRRQRIQDEQSKIEVIRYFGLAAARENSVDDLDVAVRALKNEFFSSGNKQRALSMAFFVEGFSKRLALEYKAASEVFEQAFDKISEVGGAHRQKGTILTEWVRALLLCAAPDYIRAVKLARDSVSIQYTVQSIDVLVRALIAQTYHQSDLSDDFRDRNFEEINALIGSLAEKCSKSGFALDQMRRVDLEAEEAYKKKRADLAGELNLSSAILLADDVYKSTMRNDILPRVWQLRYQTEVGRNLTKLRADVEAFLSSHPHANLRLRSHAARYLVETTIASKGAESAKVEFRRYESIFPESVKAELKSLLRGSGATIDLRDPSLY